MIQNISVKPSYINKSFQVLIISTFLLYTIIVSVITVEILHRYSFEVMFNKRVGVFYHNIKHDA